MFIQSDFAKLDNLIPELSELGHVLHAESEGLSRIFYSRENANHVTLRAWSFSVRCATRVPARAVALRRATRVRVLRASPFKRLSRV